jgi:hypothetical protein
MKKTLISFLLLCSLSYWVQGQIKFSTLSEVQPQDDVKFLVGDGANNARKISYATLKTFLGIGIYPTKVVSVADMNNPTNIRNKIVQTTSGLSYAVDFMGNAVSLGSFELTPQNVVTIHNEQTITGRKTFADTATFSKGLKSNGLITEGSSLKAAASINGVQANKTEIVEANKTLDGTSNVLLVRPQSMDIELSLPPPNSSMKGWFYIVKKDNAQSFYVVIKDNSGTVLKRIYSNGMSLKAECDGSIWSVY